jgi:hypothetical protein
MLPRAHIGHRTTNRLRLRIPSRKGDADYFAAARERLSQCRGVETIEVNSVTGSVLLLHQLELHQLARFGTENGLFSLESSNIVPKTINDKVVASLREFNGQISQFTGNELDLPSIAFLGLVGLGIYELSIGNFVVPFWHTAFWYALSVVLNSRSDAGRPPGAEHVVTGPPK